MRCRPRCCFWTGVVRDRLRFDTGTIAAKIGIALIVYALALHPLIAPLSGRPWTQAEIFGLAPDPTVIATLGVIVAAARPNWHLLVLPLLWCVISGLTLWTMESPEAPVLAWRRPSRSRGSGSGNRLVFSRSRRWLIAP